MSVPLAVFIVGAVLLAAIGIFTRQPAVSGQAIAAERIDPVAPGNGGLNLVDATSQFPLDAADDDVLAVITDLNTYWAAELPEDFGTDFVSLTGGYTAVNTSAPSGSAICVSTPGDLTGNAYYCPSGDGIVYDSAALVPVLLGHYGPAGLTAAFAHEFGHSIQARIGPTTTQRGADPGKYPSLLIEAQGDCFAGSFLAWVVSGAAPHVHLDAASMVQAVAPLLDFADPITVPANDPAAHGLALDRLSSILLGYRSGPLACHRMTAGSLDYTLGRAGVVSTLSGPRFQSVSATMAAARTSITAFAATTATHNSLTGLEPAGPDLQLAASYGQFAQSASLALAVGRQITGSETGAACFTGAWAASVFGKVSATALGGWAGDADEALNLIRARPAASFDDLAGYADGFRRGWAACRSE